MSYDKGARREHELMEICEENGYAVMRSAGSGKGGTKSDGEEREQPDIIAGNSDEVYAFESKAVGGDKLYIPKGEVGDLEYFAEAFGAKPIIAVRFDRCDFHFFNRDGMYETKKSLRVKKENLSQGDTIRELLC